MNNKTNIPTEKWLETMRVIVRNGELATNLSVSLSAVEWVQVVMIADKNKMKVEQVISYLVRSGDDLVEIANRGYVLEKAA